MCPCLKSLPPQFIPFWRTSPDTPFPQELSPTAPVSSCLRYFTCQSHRIWKHVFHSDISVFFKLQLVLPTNPPKGINIIHHKPIYGPVFPSKYITYHSQKRLPRKVIQFDLKVGRVEYQRPRKLRATSCFQFYGWQCHVLVFLFIYLTSRYNFLELGFSYFGSLSQFIWLFFLM